MNHKAGKTYEELYGIEKAKEMKLKKSLAFRGDKNPNFGDNHREGKTYEELYGIEKANQMKEQKKISFSGENNPNFGKDSHRKGKSITEEYGEERALEISNKISKSGIGRIPYNKGKTFEEIFGEEKAKELKKKNSEIQKEKSTKLGKTYNEYYGYTKSTLIKRKQRISAIKRLINNISNGGQIQPRYNPTGCDYFDKIMEQTNTFIQHAQNGGEYNIKELGYWVDGYDIENNIVYEFDEKRHFNSDGSLKDKDIQRQKEITDFLNCEFIRIKH